MLASRNFVVLKTVVRVKIIVVVKDVAIVKGCISEDCCCEKCHASQP